MKARLALLVSLALGGCAQTLVHKLSDEEYAAASKKAETPAGLSTVQFKELGDTRRAEVIEKIVGATWGEKCKPTSVKNSGYAPNGSSQWSVSCEGSTLSHDYSVSLPENASNKARVLKCFKWANTLTCDLVGHP